MRAIVQAVVCFLALVSCGGARPPEFHVTETGARLVAANEKAAAGVLEFSKPARLEYHFENPPRVAPPSSLEIAYSFSSSLSREIKNKYRLALEFESGGAWLLPLDLSFLETPGGAVADADASALVFHYAIPASDPFPASFSVSLASSGSKTSGGEEPPRFSINALAVTPRWYGFYPERRETGDHFFVTPFVFARNAGNSVEYVIDRPESGPAELSVSGGASGFSVSVEDRVFETAARELYLAPGFIDSAGQLSLRGDHIEQFQLRHAAAPLFPSPLTADPGVILDWPLERWRDSRFEVFRWESFPSLLIFDTADYEVQDRMLKRLAFFVEKAGFRGRLAPDAEIADLHGWNAHDYRAADLARFFEIARAENFPLLREERELEKILLDAGIIQRAADGTIAGGQGGIISVSRESAAYLRSLFMAHEGFHGLFFIDEDFRAFSRRRWQEFPRAAKDFILGYFDYQHYDIGDDYLTVNEFMAHILQQPASRAAVYFGETLPRRLETSPRRASVLGGKEDETNSWPEYADIFTREARAFSDWVNQRWNLAAGRVWQVF